MAGLENITKTIVDTAHNEADEIINQAKSRAAQIVADAQGKAKQSELEILSEANKRAAAIKSSAESSCRLDEKNQLLNAKMNLINEAFQAALEKLRSLDTDAYFNVIKRLIVASACRGEGELILSSADRARMPSGFMNMVKAALDDKKTVNLSDDTDDSILGGCILRYNDIEINCSFDAQLNFERERLTDAVNAMLFN